MFYSVHQNMFAQVVSRLSTNGIAFYLFLNEHDIHDFYNNILVSFDKPTEEELNADLKDWRVLIITNEQDKLAAQLSYSDDTKMSILYGFTLYSINALSNYGIYENNMKFYEVMEELNYEADSGQT